MLARTLSSPPLDQLGRMGDARRNPEGWPETSIYLPERLGLNEEHVPALIGIGRLWADPDFDPGDERLWAPIHAWRILGELRAADAVGPLLEMTDVLAERHDDWYLSEYPGVFGLIGPPAVAPLASLLADRQRKLSPRACAAESLANIARRHCEPRDDVVAVLCDQLTMFPLNGSELNGFIVAALLDISATESAELMQRAFAAGQVDEVVVGDWAVVQRKMKEFAAHEEESESDSDEASAPCPWVFQYMDAELAQAAEDKRTLRKKRRRASARRKTAGTKASRKPR